MIKPIIAWLPRGVQRSISLSWPKAIALISYNIGVGDEILISQEQVVFIQPNIIGKPNWIFTMNLELPIYNIQIGRKKLQNLENGKSYRFK